MKTFKVSIVNNETGEEIYTETSTKAADLNYFVTQALENNCHAVFSEPEVIEKRKINFTELLKKSKI